MNSLTVRTQNANFRRVALVLIFLIVVSAVIKFSLPRMTPSGSQSMHQLATFPDSTINAVWDWRSVTKIDPAQLNQELATLQTYKFNTIYLNVTDYTDLYEMPSGSERDTALQQFNQAVNQYISTAQKHNFTVQALSGSPSWADSSHWYMSSMVVDFVYDYNAAYPNAAFAGMQFDIEPYSQKDFVANKNAMLIDYLNGYQQVIDHIKSKNTSGVNTATTPTPTASAVTSPLALGVTVPYWFDRQIESTDIVSFNNQNKLPYYHVIDLLTQVPNSYVAIMDYRNYTDGDDGSIANVQNELDYASQKNVGVIIGQETGNETPAKITFYGQEKTDLQKAILNLNSAYAQNSAFKGFAVNNLSSYLELKGE